jgi:hypothetical protein
LLICFFFMDRAPPFNQFKNFWSEGGVGIWRGERGDCSADSSG